MTAQLPQNADAERAVIGAILYSPAHLSDVIGIVEPTDFHHPAHEAIFAAMLALDARQTPVDAVTVAAAMREADTMGRLRALGEDVYFAELISGVVTPENIAYHARLVADRAVARRLLFAGQEIAARAADDCGDAEELAGEAERLVFEAGKRGNAEQIHGARDILRVVAKTLERRYDRKQAVTGVPSGYGSFDAMTAGFQPSELAIVAARPSMGKTAFAGNVMARAAIEDRIPSLFFSLEMSKEALVERMIASEAKADTMRLRTGYLDQRDWINLTKASARISEAPFWIHDRPSSMADIRSRARRWRMNERQGGQGEAAIVIVDYLQLVRPPESKRRDQNREREIAEISKALKDLAKELRCPVLALAQLSRDCERRADKRPTLADLRESGQIEQDADLIAFLYRDEVYNKESQDKGVAEVIIAKQRSGAIGTVRLAYLAPYTLFENLSERGQ